MIELDDYLFFFFLNRINAYLFIDRTNICLFLNRINIYLFIDRRLIIVKSYLYKTNLPVDKSTY